MPLDPYFTSAVRNQRSPYEEAMYQRRIKDPAKWRLKRMFTRGCRKAYPATKNLAVASIIK